MSTGNTGVQDGGDFSGSFNGTVILNGAAAATNEGVGQNVPGLNQGSKVSLSLSDIDLVMQRIYQEGGKASKIMLSPKLRRDL